MADVAEATPTGSLEAAASGILNAGLLGGEDTPPRKERQPEQREAPKPAKQAPAAPDAEEESPAEESEQEAAPPQSASDAEAEAEAPAPEPQRYTVKIDGKDVEVTLDEALKGYSRHEDYTRKTQLLADERKRFEAEEVQAVRAERRTYAETLGQLEMALKALVGEPDWAALERDLPPEVFKERFSEWRQVQGRIHQVQAERQRVMQQEYEAAEKETQQRLADEARKLNAVIPDFADPEKGEHLGKTLREYASTLGFTQDESNVTDHRLVVLLHKAYQYDQAQKAAPKIQQKIEKAIPSTGPGASKATEKPKSKLDTQRRRFSQTGKTEDAAPLIAALLED